MNAARRQTAGQKTPPKTFWQRMRRLLHYRFVIPLMRSRHTPEHAARGSFVGLFCAFTPSVGIQTPLVLAAWAIARRFPGWDFNLILAIAWTWVTNAFTALPCYYVFYLTGEIMFGRWNRLTGFDDFRLMWGDIFSADQGMLEQMQALARLLILDWGATILVGSLPWAFLTGWLGYRYSLKFVLAYRHARAERMKKRHSH
jgi:uncharacterized protein (DUF2062 family)